MPCTSAAAERNWNIFGNTKSVRRCNLTGPRTIKLVSVKENLTLFNPNAAKKKTKAVYQDKELISLNPDESETENDEVSGDSDGESHSYAESEWDSDGELELGDECFSDGWN